MDQNYRRGWQSYSFERATMHEVKAHGAQSAIRASAAFNRGPGKLQMSLLEIPSGVKEDSIGLHIHRDFPTGRDVEEIYILVEGEGVMTFTNGDETSMRPGDIITTYPGTGHAFRVVGEHTARMIVVVPEAFRSDRPPASIDDFPTEFVPQIRIVSCHPTAMSPVEAECRACGATWSVHGCGVVDAGLPEWAAHHECS